MKLKLYFILSFLLFSADLFAQTIPTGVTVTAFGNSNSTSLLFKGVVGGDGGSPITDKGFVYGTSINPTITSNLAKYSKGTGTFSDITVNGLPPGTAYHVRAYAVNAIGIAYSADKLVSTRPAVPGTPIVSDVTTTGFKLNFVAPQSTTSFRYDVATDEDFINKLTGYNDATGTTTLHAAVISGLTPNTTYYFRLRAINGSGPSASSVTGSQTTLGPAVTASSLAAFSACAGSASAEQSFTVSGSYLTGNIAVTPPAGFELAATSGGPYSNSALSLTPAAGTVNATTIYARMVAAATSPPSAGNIEVSAAGAATQSVAVSGSVSDLPVLTLGIIEAVYSSETSFSIPYSGATGTQYSIAATGTMMPGFTPTVDEPLSGSPLSVAIPASGANVYDFTLTVKNAGGCTADYPFTLKVVTPTISVNAGLTAMSAIYGNASASQSFTVSGSNLTEGVLVTAPAGFEVSSDGTVFSGAVTIGSSGTVDVRLADVTSAGDYSGNITLSSSGAVPVNVSVSGSVNPAPITITAGNVSKTYGTALAEGPGSLNFNVTSGALKNDNTIGSVTVSYTDGAAANSAVATYMAVVIPSFPVGDHGFLASNYEITYVPGNIIVDKAVPLITFGALADATYGDSDIPLTASSTNTGTAITYTSDNPAVATVTADNKIHVEGASTSPIHITASQVADANHHEAISVSQLFTVNRAAAVIGLSDLNSEYDGIPHPVAVVTEPAGLSGLSVTYEGSVTTPTVAGTYAVVASLNNANYTAADATGTLVIGKAPLTITATGPVKPLGTSLSITTTTNTDYFSVTGTQNNEVVTSVTLTPDAAGMSASTPAGIPYVVTPSAATGPGFSANNYNINYVPFNGIAGSFLQNIAFEPLGAVAYGDSPLVLSALASSGLAVSYTSSNTAVATVADNVMTIVGAGTTTITASQAGNSSYAPAAPAMQDLTVNPKALIITATGPAKVYGTGLTEMTSTTNFTTSAMAPGEGISSVHLLPDEAGLSATVAAGTTYTVTPSQAAGTGGFLAGNYNITYLPFNGTVSKAALTITASGINKVYNNSVNAAVVLTDDRINGDQLTATYTAVFDNKNVGTGRAINVSAITLSGAASANYTFNTTATATANITAAAVTVTAQTDTKVYDKTISSALSPVLSGLIAGDAIGTAPTQAFDNSNVGINKILTASGLVIDDGNGGKNYSVNYVADTEGAITRANLTIVADNQRRNFGEANPILTASYSGFIGGDTQAGLTAAPMLSTTATPESLPGNYPIIATGGAAANYNISYVPGTLTVVPLMNAGLTDLTISKGTLDPAFAAGTLSYAVSVANGTSSISLRPVLSDASASVTVNGLPTGNGSFSGDIPLNLGDNRITVQVTAQDGITQQMYTLNVYRAVDPGLLQATNLLTPNGDGKNDTWVIKDVELYPDNTVKIFDRAGRMLWNAKGYDNSWNGTLNGSPLEEGTYFYILNLGINKRTQRGYITIVREN